MRRRNSRVTRRNVITGLLFTLPWLIGMSVFLLYPIGSSLYRSFFRWNLFMPARFTGLLNWGTLLQDDLFWVALQNSLLYTVMFVPLSIITSIILALMLNMKIRGMSFFRVVYYMPCIVPMVAAATLWVWLFNYQFGLINNMLGMIGIQGPPWLSSSAWAKPSLVIMALWMLGPGIVIYLSALQDVPQQLYDAAKIDTANWLQRTWYITLPMITPVILFQTVINFIGSLQEFTRVFVMTDGGPGNATLFYALYIYRQAFGYFRMGYASALSWVLFVLVFMCTLFVFRTSRRWVYYGGE